MFRQFTRGAGRLRHTAWRGLREDRKPADVLAPRACERVDAEAAPASGRRSAPRPNEPDPTAAASAPLGPKVTVQAGNLRLTLSNLDKAAVSVGVHQRRGRPLLLSRR